MALQSLDIKRMSATTVPQTQIREPVTGTVAKLIDVSKCIGCKACQTACMEWNDLRDEIGTTTGVYDNPRDLSEHSWTVMRYSEYENPKGDLEWLIRKDGCMHCEDPGCLKACPSPGAIIQYTNGIVDFTRKTASAAATASRAARSTCRASRRRTTASTSARCARTVSRSARNPHA